MAIEQAATEKIFYVDLSNAELIEMAIKRGEAQFAHSGAIATLTGERTGRSPKDRFIVQEPNTLYTVDWGKTNIPFDADAFDLLWQRVGDYLTTTGGFVNHLQVGAHPDYALPVKVTTETAWHGLFARNMFINPEPRNKFDDAAPGWQVLHAANFSCDPDRDGTQSEACVIIHFGKRRVLIAGMAYAGELKKAMFSVQNFLLPDKDVLPMHCAANVGEDGDTCLFFGLSGTGKTTLSADPNRFLIGDDEHGWGRGTVFNFEGGCYAKTIDLSRENEPVIWDAIRYGAIVENVAVNSETRTVDYSSTRYSENGRCSYPLSHIGKRVMENRAGEPSTILFLTCDISGVLPPVAILSKEAAAYHFISGYTAKVGSTEVGGSEAIAATFSACFGAPFMPRPAREYAELLMQRIESFDARVYLVNTGWTGGSGGPDGHGSRFPIPVTRAVVCGIQKGLLDGVETEHLDIMNLAIPAAMPGVPEHYLNPRKAWPDPFAYDKAATDLAAAFADNIRRFVLQESVIAAGPQIP